MARRVIRSALLCTVCVALSSAFFACERQKDENVSPPASPPAAASAPTAKSPRGAGVPFEAGDAPDIRELEKVDLAKFVAGEPWCTKGRGGRRVSFAAGGDYAEAEAGANGAAGEREKRGTWQVKEGRLIVATPGEEARDVDARAASVNEKEVLLLDGLLYGRCAEQG